MSPVYRSASGTDKGYSNQIILSVSFRLETGAKLR